MIGQSGLPMMNNLAGSKEKTPGDVQVKDAPVDAGAFEKILAPESLAITAEAATETPADGPKSPPESLKGLPLADANSIGVAVARVQTDTGNIIVSEAEKLHEEPISAAPETIKGPSETGNPEIVQTLAPAPENKGADGRQITADGPVATPEPSPDGAETQFEASSDDESQKPSERGANAPQPDALVDAVDRPSLEDSTPLEAANIPQKQADTDPLRVDAAADDPNDQPSSRSSEAGKVAPSENTPELPVNSVQAVSRSEGPSTDEGEFRPQQQSSPPLSASPAGPSPEVTAALQGKGNVRDDAAVVANPAITKAEGPERNAQLAVAQPSENKGLAPGPQVEIERQQPGFTHSRGDTRSALVLGNPDTPPEAVKTTLAGASSLADGGGLKAIAQNPAAQFQTLTPETFVFSQNASSDPFETLVGSVTSINATSASRLDGPAPAAMPPPASADAKLIVQQVNQAIIRMDGSRTEIMLDPVELGRVSLTFVTKDEGVTVVINADRQETADLLRRNGEQLQRDLANAGYEDVELDFNQGDDARPDPSAADQSDDIGTARSSSLSYEGTYVTSGLDIRI